MKEPVPDEQIRAYLKGRLEGPALRQFERLLDDNADLTRSLALRRAEMAASELLIASETREWFKTWGEEMPPPQKSALKSVVLWILGSGLFLTVLLWAIWPQTPPNTTDTPSVVKPSEGSMPKVSPKTTLPSAAAVPTKPDQRRPAAQAYVAMALQQLPNPVRSNVRRSGPDTTIGALRKAQLAFADGDYPQTLALLAQTDSAQAQSAAFLAAHALFRLKRFDEAEARFAELMDRNSRQYKFQSEWGLLMCRLAGLPDEKKAFHDQLDAILKQKDHPYFNQAEALKMMNDE